MWLRKTGQCVPTVNASSAKDKVGKTPSLGEVWKILEQRGWLADRAPHVRNELRSIARVRIYRPGEPLYTVGEAPRGVYGVARGALDISIPRQDGQEIVVHRAQSGFWIGDLALFSGQARLVTVVASTETVAACLPRSRLAQLLEQHPELIADFYVLSHRNVATLLQLLANLSIPRAETRIALRLLIYDQRQTNTQDWIPLSQEKLAELTALSVPTVQRALRGLVEIGLVELGYGRLRIRDRERLLRYCG
jgi:CRP/FNR family cyclic AMP-dependent transcriptional regulator